MMHRTHVSSPQRSWYRAAAAGLAVCAAFPTITHAQALVQGVRVESGTAGTVVAVSLTDSVARSAFTLTGPDRIVVDLPGTTLGALGGRSYDGQFRGPVQNVRMSQYRADVVRVVIDVDGSTRFRISGGSEVRIAFAGGRDVATWSTGQSMPESRPVAESAREVAAVAVMDSSAPAPPASRPSRASPSATRMPTSAM
jgi:hypothetical protein